MNICTFSVLQWHGSGSELFELKFVTTEKSWVFSIDKGLNIRLMEHWPLARIPVALHMPAADK